MACEKRLPDGSYLSTCIFRTDWRHKTNGIALRVVDYCLEGIEGSEPIYRLATTILNPDKGPANELAAPYHERWRSKLRSTNLRPTCACQDRATLEDPPIWCVRSSTDSNGSLRNPRPDARSSSQSG